MTRHEPISGARRRFLLVALAAAILAALPATLWADDDDDDDDHEQARAAVKRGDAVPLAEILPVVATAVPGKVMGVKIEHDDGRLIYEFKVLTPAGAYFEVEVDARTKQVLEIERK